MKQILSMQVLEVTRRRTKSALSRLLHEESGQSMTEYILILAMVLMIFSKLKGVFLNRIMTMVNKVGTGMEQAAQDDSGG
mgnify:CR=1 FL=1